MYSRKRALQPSGSKFVSAICWQPWGSVELYVVKEFSLCVLGRKRNSVVPLSWVYLGRKSFAFLHGYPFPF